MNPKERIVAKFGGQEVVATICGITQGAVSQWGDYIPSRHQSKLVAAAPDYGFTLTLNEFIGLSENDNHAPSNNTGAKCQQ